LSKAIESENADPFESSQDSIEGDEIKLEVIDPGNKAELEKSLPHQKTFDFKDEDDKDEFHEASGKSLNDVSGKSYHDVSGKSYHDLSHHSNV